MDEIRFWSDVRTKEETNSGRDSHIDPESQGLVAAYDFNQAESTRPPSQDSGANLYLAPVVQESLKLSPVTELLKLPNSAEFGVGVLTANPKAHGVKRLQALLVGGDNSENQYLGMRENRVGIPVETNSNRETGCRLSVKPVPGIAGIWRRCEKSLPGQAGGIRIRDMSFLTPNLSPATPPNTPLPD